MSHASLASLFQDTADQIRKMTGNPDPIKADNFPDAMKSIRTGQKLQVYATTIRKSATQTENYASNDMCRIGASDGKAYTLAEWNAMFVANGYSRVGLPTPMGFVFTMENGSLVQLFWDTCQEHICIPNGTAYTGTTLKHSPYNTLTCITAADSGTDITTDKAWSITSDDENNEWVLYTAATKQSFRIPKGIGYVDADADLLDFAERTESLYQITEWYRHRFAVTSGVATTAADGTMGLVGIFNSNGEQPAVGEDMYFYVRATENDAWQATGLLAKYNLNNLHKGASTVFTETIRNTLYDSQKTNGVNMNDTAANSDSRKLLVTGAKGAEAIAVDGYWHIITPYITRADNASEQTADAPAVYWVRGRGQSLPPGDAINMWFFNKTIVNAIRTYLNNVEGWGLITGANDWYWSSARYSGYNAWFVGINGGTRLNYSAYSRYSVCGASGLSTA